MTAHHPRPPSPCDVGHLYPQKYSTPIPIPTVTIAFPNCDDDLDYYGGYNNSYCGSDFTATTTTTSSAGRFSSIRRLTRSSSSLGLKSGQRGRASSSGASTSLGDFAEAARDTMVERRRPWGRAGSFRASRLDSPDSRSAPLSADDDDLDGYVPYRPPYVSQPSPSTSQPIVIKPSGAQGIGLAPKRTPPKHGHPPISKKPSFFRKLLGAARNERSKLTSASTPSLGMHDTAERPHYHQHQHQHYHYQRHGRQPSQSSTQFYQAKTYSSRHYQTKRHDSRNIPSVGTGLSGPSVLFSPLTRDSSVRHSVRHGSTGDSNVSNLNVALLGDSSNMNIQPAMNRHLYASTPNLNDMSEKQSQSARDWRHTREHRRPGASITHSNSNTQATPPTRRRSLRRGESTLSLHSEGSRSRLAVSTMCDALTFPRPRMNAHEVTPPDSPTDDEAMSSQVNTNVSEFKQAMQATKSRNTEREDWAAMTRRPSGSSMHRKSSSWSRGSDCSHSQPSIVGGPNPAFNTPGRHRRGSSRDRGERDYGERIYPQRTHSASGSLRSFFIGSSNTAHSEDNLLNAVGRRSRPSSRMSYSDTEQSSNLHSGSIRPGSASSGHSFTVLGSSRGLPKSTSTPSLVPHKLPRPASHGPRRSKSHCHSRRNSVNTADSHVPPPPVIRHAGPPRAFQFHLQSAAKGHTGVVTIGGTSQERSRHFRPPPPPPVSARPVDFAQARLRRPQSSEPPAQRRSRPRRLSSPVNLDGPPVRMVSIKAAADDEIGLAISTDRNQPSRSPVRKRLDIDDDSASAHARYLAARQQRQNASVPSLLSDGPVTPTADRQVLPPPKTQPTSGPFQFRSKTSSVVPVTPKESQGTSERKDRFLSSSDVPPVPALQASWYAAHARSPSTPPLATQSVVNIPAETDAGPSSPRRFSRKGSERGSVISDKPIRILTTPTASSSYPESPSGSTAPQSFDSPTTSPFADVHRAPASAPARIPPRRAPPTHPPPPAPVFAPSHSRDNSQSRSGSSWKFNAPSVSSGSQYSQTLVTPARSKSMTANMTPLGFLAAASPPKSVRELTPEDQEPAMEESPEGTQPRSDTPPPKARETLMDESPTPIRTFRVKALAPPRSSATATTSFAAQQAAAPLSASGASAAQPLSPSAPLSPSTPLGSRLNMGSTSSLVPVPVLPDSLPDSSPLIGQVSPVSPSQPLASPAPETPTFGADRNRSTESVSTTTSAVMPSMRDRGGDTMERSPAAAAAILKRRGQGNLSIQTSPSADRIRQDHRHLSVTRSLTPDSIARSILSSEMSETTLPDLFAPPEESEASHYSSAMDEGPVDHRGTSPEQYFTPTTEEQQPMFPDFHLESIEQALRPFPKPPTASERDRPLPPPPSLTTRGALSSLDAIPGPSRPTAVRASSTGAITTISSKSSNQSIRFAATVKQQEEKRSATGSKDVLEKLLTTPRVLSRRSSGHSTAHSTAFEYDKRSSLISLSSGSEGSLRPSLDGDFNGLFFRAPPAPAPLGHPFNRNSQHRSSMSSESPSGSVIAPLASIKRTPLNEQQSNQRHAVAESPAVGGSEGTPELRTPLTGDPQFGRLSTLPTPPHPPSPRASPPRVTLDLGVLESPPRTVSYEPRGEIDISASPLPTPASRLDEHSWITNSYRLSQQSVVVRSRSATSSRGSSFRKPRSASGSGDVSFSPTTFGVHSLPSSAPGSGTSTPILLDEIRVQRQLSSSSSRRRS